MKRLMMVLAVVLFDVICASAATEVVDGVIWSYSVSDGKASVYKGSHFPAISGATKGALTIPAMLGGCPVTSIGRYAFSGCSGLTSVTIPSSVTSIASYVFSGCSGLTSVTIPSSVTSIASYVFDGCSGLTSVTIPSSVTSIASYAFYGCSGLTSVTIPSSVTSIDASAFCNCSNLTAILVEVGNTVYCSTDGFLYNKAMTELIFCPKCKTGALAIPNGVTSIGASAFSGCGGLTSMTIPMGVLFIEGGTFRGCTSLLKIDIPISVLSIASDAFDYCRSVRRLTIPASVVEIAPCRHEADVWPQEVEFLGAPPIGIGGVLGNSKISYSREYGFAWQKIVVKDKFSGYGRSGRPDVAIVSAAIREGDPTVMDVIYKVKSAKSTVKVRALAFQDGERSFAKVVRPAEFIEDTAKNIGDTITANEEHEISWRASADWNVDLAKVKFEVLASDGDLLPLELTTIPKIGDHAAMEISWNAITEPQVFDALLWLYTDGDEGLTLSDGVLKNGTSQLVYKTGHLSADAIGYVYGKMGFSVLSGNELKYANEMTRLGLSPSGMRQYAWRAVEE